MPHLLRAGLQLDPSLQLVLLAGAADTPELKAETDALIAELRASRDGVFVVSEMLPREEVRQVLTHALAFCCPSVYEPLGIVNLEAMACETAVVASRGRRHPRGRRRRRDRAPRRPRRGVRRGADFERRFAAAVNRLAADPEEARRMGQAGPAPRRRGVRVGGVAERTVELYGSLR